MSGTLAPNNPSELWPHYKVLLRGQLSYWDFVVRFCITKGSTFGTQILGANLARTSELAAILRPHMLQRRQHDVLPDLPPLRWSHGPVAPENVPPQPELTVEAAAILGRIKREAAISVTDAMHLAMLRRWTGVAEAPAVAELIQNDLASVSKVVVFAIHCEVIKFIADAIGPVAAVINGRYVAVSAPGNDRRFPELGSATRADPADQRSRHRIDVARGASRHFC